MAYGVDRYPNPPEYEEEVEREYDENLSPRFDDLGMPTNHLLIGNRQRRDAMIEWGYSIVPNKQNYSEFPICWGFSSRIAATEKARERLYAMCETAYAKIWIRSNPEQCGIVTERKEANDE